MKVALIQDRPVLGGTGSSEIRVWMLGATSHMGNNNRWAREGGIVDEILVENIKRWYSQQRITGILSVFNKIMPDVSNWGKTITTG